jgi:hypothetical protein
MQTLAQQTWLLHCNLLGDAQSASADCVASQVKTLTHKVGVFSKRIFDKVLLGKTKGIL